MGEFEKRLGDEVPLDLYSCQQEQLKRGTQAWVVLSGKITSGKDTVAPLLDLPGSSISIVSYGDILRKELFKAMQELNISRNNGETLFEQISTVQESLNLEPPQAGELLSLLMPELDKKPDLTPWDRTDSLRNILQKLGSVWLPNLDYLPVTAVPTVMQIIKDGGSVVSAGSRFRSDTDIPTLAGAITVRLDVSLETQLRRLKKRDGLQATPSLMESLNHPGETELDNYPFDIRVDNNIDEDEQPGALKALMQEINTHVKAILNERQLALEKKYEDFRSIKNLGNQPVGDNC